MRADDALKYLNVGCGGRYHAAWTNVDVAPASPEVIRHDLRHGLPFADGAFDLVYHSHVLEHFERSQALRFLKECVRVLRPGGVLRVAIPDLESIVRGYLGAMERAVAGDKSAAADYDWMMLELYDQTVRTTPSGAVLEFLANPDLANEDFVRRRWGAEVERMLNAVRRRRGRAPEESAARRTPLSTIKAAVRCLLRPWLAKEVLIRRLLGVEYASLELGRFRRSGVIHYWMYDRFSLGRALEKAGLVKIVLRSASESYVADWSSFNLDTEPDGSSYKPDSLYMEGIKP